MPGASLLAAGTHSVTAIYGGDVNFTGATASDMVSVDSPPTAVAGGPYTVVRGGSVTLERAPEGGTVVRLDFPRATLA